jgi:hypothetical protein
LPDLERFIASPWDFLQFGDASPAAQDKRYQFIRLLCFSPVPESPLPDPPLPLDYAVFYSPFAFPICHRHTGVTTLVNSLVPHADRFQDLIPLVAQFIVPELTPLRSDVILLQKPVIIEELQSKSQPKSEVLVLMLDGGLQVGLDTIKGEIALRDTGFAANRFLYRIDSHRANLIVDYHTRGLGFSFLVGQLSQTGYLADALNSPNMILPLALLNSPSFPRSHTQILFRFMALFNFHHFFVRSLLLAEISHRRLSIIFRPRTLFGKPLLVLFSAFGMNWALGVLKHLAQLSPVDPLCFVKALTDRCDNLPTESFYILRVICIVSLFAIGDPKSVFELFLRFMFQAFHTAERLKNAPSASATALISQLILAIENGAADDQVLALFTAFLVRTLKRVPDIEITDDIDMDVIQAYVKKHEADVCARVKLFLDEPADRHILALSFAQNFRFLANAQKKDRNRWISLLWPGL